MALRAVLDASPAGSVSVDAGGVVRGTGRAAELYALRCRGTMLLGDVDAAVAAHVAAQGPIPAELGPLDRATMHEVRRSQAFAFVYSARRSMAAKCTAEAAGVER